MSHYGRASFVFSPSVLPFSELQLLLQQQCRGERSRSGKPIDASKPSKNEETVQLKQDLKGFPLARALALLLNWHLLEQCEDRSTALLEGLFQFSVLLSKCWGGLTSSLNVSAHCWFNGAQSLYRRAIPVPQKTLKLSRFECLPIHAFPTLICNRDNQTALPILDTPDAFERHDPIGRHHSSAMTNRKANRVPSPYFRPLRCF